MNYEKDELLLIVEHESYFSCCKVGDIVKFEAYTNNGDVIIKTTNGKNIIHQNVRFSAVVSCESLTPLMKAIYGL